MPEIVGPFNSYEKYFLKLAQILQRYFKSPHNPRDFINLRINNQGKIVGWDIDKTKLQFKESDCCLFVREKAIVNGEDWYYEFFSYHYLPSNKKLHMFFRVDLDTVSLHGNPDNRFSPREHLIYPQDVKLKIDRYNLIAAIFISYRYKNNHEQYPFDNDYSDVYNQIITTCL